MRLFVALDRLVCIDTFAAPCADRKPQCFTCLLLSQCGVWLFTYVGVLTKLDIMDKGTDARAVLDGQSVRLKHGWVAVVNRGQKDINDNLSMEVRCCSSACPAYNRRRAELHGAVSLAEVPLERVDVLE